MLKLLSLCLFGLFGIAFASPVGDAPPKTRRKRPIKWAKPGPPEKLEERFV